MRKDANMDHMEILGAAGTQQWKFLKDGIEERTMQHQDGTCVAKLL